MALLVSSGGPGLSKSSVVILAPVPQRVTTTPVDGRIPYVSSGPRNSGILALFKDAIIAPESRESGTRNARRDHKRDRSKNY